MNSSIKTFTVALSLSIVLATKTVYCMLFPGPLLADQSNSLSRIATRLEQREVFAGTCPQANQEHNDRLNALKSDVTQKEIVEQVELLRVCLQRYVPQEKTTTKIFNFVNSLLFVTELGLTGLAAGKIQILPQSLLSYFSTYQCIASACAAAGNIVAMTIEPKIRSQVYNAAGLSQADINEQDKENPSLTKLTKNIEQIGQLLETLRSEQVFFSARKLARNSMLIYEGEKVLMELITMVLAILSHEVPRVHLFKSIENYHGLWFATNLIFTYKSAPSSIKQWFANSCSRIKGLVDYVRFIPTVKVFGMA